MFVRITQFSYNCVSFKCLYFSNGTLSNSFEFKMRQFLRIFFTAWVFPASVIEIYLTKNSSAKITVNRCYSVIVSNILSPELILKGWSSKLTKTIFLRQNTRKTAKKNQQKTTDRGVNLLSASSFFSACADIKRLVLKMLIQGQQNKQARTQTRAFSPCTQAVAWQLFCNYLWFLCVTMPNILQPCHFFFLFYN